MPAHKASLSSPPTGLRIAAGGVSRDSLDILAPAVAHLISQGITDFYLVFHREDEDVSRKLLEAMSGRANFTIIHHNHVKFHQASITNLIMSIARDEGFEVFIPFDADEFIIPSDHGVTLRRFIEDWVESGDGEQLLFPMVNFFVPNDVDVFTADVLKRMPYRVELKPGVDRSEISPRLNRFSKAIVRLSGFDDAPRTRIVGGNHKALLGMTPLTVPRASGSDAVPLMLCHVPWRSRSSTMAPPRPTRAFQTSVRRPLSVSSAETASVLEQTWNEYSLSHDQLLGRDLERPWYELVPDETCHRIVTGIQASGFNVTSSTCQSVRVDQAFSHEKPRVFVDDLLFDAAVVAIDAERHHGVSAESTDKTNRQLAKAGLQAQRETIRALRNDIAQLRQGAPVSNTKTSVYARLRRKMGHLRNRLFKK